MPSSISPDPSTHNPDDPDDLLELPLDALAPWWRKILSTPNLSLDVNDQTFLASAGTSRDELWSAYWHGDAEAARRLMPQPAPRSETFWYQFVFDGAYHSLDETRRAYAEAVAECRRAALRARQERLVADSPTSPHPESTRRALAYLHDRGAHFVLLADKKPLWKGYQKRRPALELVLQHGEIGFVPWSIETTALDVDSGKSGQLQLKHPPLVALASRRGEHLYYRDDEPRRNGNWNAFGCSGQVRGANGFLRLWHPEGPVNLSIALAHDPYPRKFPADLISAPPAKRHRPPADPGEPYTRRIPHRDRDRALSAVPVGNRNNSLFDVVRFWAYAAPKPGSVAEWHDQVRTYAQTRNGDFRQPLPVQEVTKLALSVSTWVWSGGGPSYHGVGYDYTPEQRQRGGLTWGRMRRHDTRERDAAIVQAVKDGGLSMRRVARDWGLAESTVRHIVRRVRG